MKDYINKIKIEIQKRSQINRKFSDTVYFFF